MMAGEPHGSPIRLMPVSVTATRSADIGTAAVHIDSAALRENIATSIADVLTYNSTAFVKSYGRATLSTVSFRGTSASHTGVTWNGMQISSPMLGTTDFSMIPAHFIDDVRLAEGSSSITDTGGSLGGLVKLTSDTRLLADGLSGQFVQGVGSWTTFDEFLKIGYARNRWRVSARVSYATSRNDFPFTNHDKKENIYDDNHNIVSSYHPRERNRSGAFQDFQALIDTSFNSERAGRWSLDAP